MRKGRSNSIFPTDWMPLNFYQRVEVMFPVTSRHLCEKLRNEILVPARRDNCRAYDLQSDGTYVRRTPPAGEARFDAQASVLSSFKELAAIK